MNIKKTLMQVIKPSLKLQFLLVMLIISYAGTVAVLLVLSTLFSNPKAIEQHKFLNWYQAHVLNLDQLLVPNANLHNQLVTIEQHLSAFLDKPNEIEALGHTYIHYFVLVDHQGKLINAWQTDQYQIGDVTSQLPMFARDDLADALVGHFNSGVEALTNQNRLIIKPIKTNQGEILGALISEQTWDFSKNTSMFEHTLNAYSIKQILLIALAPMVLILLVVLTLILIASKRLKSDWQQFVKVIGFWQKGDFSSKLPTDKPNEIATSFQQLNMMADALAHHIEKQQQQTEMKERQFLAAELHDTVKQTLFANNLALATSLNLLQQGNNEQAAHYLQEAIKGNQHAFGQMSQLIDTLPKLEIDHLAISTFQEAIEQGFTAGEVDVDFVYHLTEDVSAVNLNLCQKVLTEAIQNVKKHSNATKIKVNFAQSENGKLLHVKIVDNGQVSKVIPSQGLKLMQQRVEQVSGKINIQPGVFSPFLGVEITLCLNN